MERAVALRGRLHGRHIELDEQVDDMDGEVEVVVRPVASTAPPASHLLDLVAGFPPGERTKHDIDQQLREDRDDWDSHG